jgi:hypothetical protein
MEPDRPERHPSWARLRLAGKVHVAVSMAAFLVILVASGFVTEAPVLLLLFLLLSLGYMLKEFDQLAGVEQWRQALADRLTDVGVPPFLFAVSAVSLLTMNQTGVWARSFE